ncbi:hypothetical protein BGZ91_005797 [Linnemannia elongata]|nr:hypothetical protein BGZ91_005797 [Linnemannia elongata]
MKHTSLPNAWNQFGTKIKEQLFSHSSTTTAEAVSSNAPIVPGSAAAATTATIGTTTGNYFADSNNTKDRNSWTVAQEQVAERATVKEHGLAAPHHQPSVIVWTLFIPYDAHSSSTIVVIGFLKCAHRYRVFVVCIECDDRHDRCLYHRDCRIWS